MKKVDLKKFGFESWKERNGSLFGDRYYAFRVDDLEIDKFSNSSDGTICLYVNPKIDDRLTKNEYSKLPHFESINEFNYDVAIDELTDDDLKRLYDNCVAYKNEYHAAIK